MGLALIAFSATAEQVPLHPATRDETKWLPAQVTQVIDGDTVEVIVDGQTERVRLLRVNTPESVHPDKKRNVPFGKVASKYTRKRLEGKAVFLEFEGKRKDHYGRLLAYVVG